MFNCLIIEDDYAFGLEVKLMVEKFGYNVESIEMEIDEITKVLNTNSIDLILSDIKLGSNTFSFDILNQIDNLPPIIFFSSYDEDEIFDKSMELNPIVYLKKPIDEVSLKSAMNSAFRTTHTIQSNYSDISRNQSQVFIRNKGQMMSIDPAKINYIKSDGNHCEILLDTKRYVIRSSIKNILEIFNTDSLMQVHRSYVINLKAIASFSLGKGEIYLSNAKIIPLGRSYKSILKKKLM